MTPVVATLHAARALIASPDAWCSGVYAETNDGTPAHWSADDAVKWCAMGAICRAAPDIETEDAAQKALVRAALQLHGVHPMTLNDRPGAVHAEILATFDAAESMAHDAIPPHAGGA